MRGKGASRLDPISKDWQLFETSRQLNYIIFYIIIAVYSLKKQRDSFRTFQKLQKADGIMIIIPWFLQGPYRHQASLHSDKTQDASSVSMANNKINQLSITSDQINQETEQSETYVELLLNGPRPLLWPARWSVPKSRHEILLDLLLRQLHGELAPPHHHLLRRRLCFHHSASLLHPRRRRIHYPLRNRLLARGPPFPQIPRLRRRNLLAAGLVGLPLFFFVLERVFPEHRLRDLIPHRLQIRHDLHPELLDPFFFLLLAAVIRRFQRCVPRPAMLAVSVAAPATMFRLAGGGDRDGGIRESQRRRSASESGIAGTASAARRFDLRAREMSLTPPLQAREREVMESLGSLRSRRRRRHLTAKYHWSVHSRTDSISFSFPGFLDSFQDRRKILPAVRFFFLGFC